MAEVLMYRKSDTDPLVPLALTVRQSVLDEIDRTKGHLFRTDWVRVAIEEKLARDRPIP